MKNLELFKQIKLNPFSNFGLTGQFWQLNLNTIFYTWIVLIALIIIIITSRICIKRNNSTGQYLVLSFIKAFRDQLVESSGAFNFNHFALVVSIFIFILLCNLISLIPFVDEPTVDLNTTLAMGIISFCYIQSASIRQHGIISYIKGFLEPIFLFAPVNIISSLSTIISMSFRLFGNIFGGAVIGHLFHSAIAGSIILETASIGVNIILAFFFVLFEGFIQAFVFSMLTLTYLAVETQEETE